MFFALIVISVFGLLIVVAGIDAFTGDHTPPTQAEVIAVTGAPKMIKDRSRLIRRKSFSFGVGDHSFFVDKQHWSDNVYESIRTAVYEADEVTVGVTPESKKTRIPFWYFTADGRTIQPYEQMLKQHWHHRRMSIIVISTYGGVILLGCTISLVSWIRRKSSS